MFCSNCGNMIDGGGKFCRHCGANTAHGSQQVQPSTTGNPVSGSSMGSSVLIACLIGVAVIVAVFYFSNDLREGFNEGFAESGISWRKVKYSSLSEAKQERLTDDLFERLDHYFISALHDDEKLLQLIILSSMGNDNGILENRIGREMVKIGEQWAADNNIDLEDWSNSIYAEDFAADYILHLIGQVAGEMNGL